MYSLTISLVAIAKARTTSPADWKLVDIFVNRSNFFSICCELQDTTLHFSLGVRWADFCHIENSAVAIIKEAKAGIIKLRNSNSTPFIADMRLGMRTSHRQTILQSPEASPGFLFGRVLIL